MGERHEQEPIQGEGANVKPAKPAVALPGRRLREQREADQLSREEVAHHLRLDAHLIQALEDDDYSQLPSAAYVCGYLRSYARLLKLPEDEIAQAYNQGELISAGLLPENVNILPQKKINTGWIKTVALIVVILLIAGGLYWLADQFNLFNVFTGKGQTDVTRKSSQLAVPLANVEPAKKPAQAVTPDTQKTVKSEPPVTAKPETKPTAIASTKATPVPQQKPKPGKTLIEKLPVAKNKIPGTEPAKVAVKTPQGNATVSNAPKTTATTPGATAGAQQTTQLHMHFDDDSWTEVTDSTGNRLVYHLVEKNTDLDLDGVPPFTVRLGNAPAVQVFYQGKQYDHSQYHRDQVASFQVGGE